MATMTADQGMVHLPILVQQRSREVGAKPGSDARWAQLILRVGLIASGAFIFDMALRTWQEGQLASHPAVTAVVFADYLAGFVLLILAVLPAPWLRWGARLIPMAITVAVVAWFYVHIVFAFPVYGTDNAVFSHVAAEQILAGHDPFSVNDPALVRRAADRFGLPDSFLTNTTDGQPVARLMSWPAGSALVLVPPLYFGLHDVRWVVVAFELGSLVVLWLWAGPTLRPLVAVPLAIDPDLFLQFTAGGVMDFIWVLPTMCAAIALYKRRLSWAAVMYGLAIGTKQQPWLLAPFLAIWLWRTSEDQSVRDRLLDIVRFGAVSGGGFLALNLPFMVNDFGGWYAGVMLPFRAQLVPFGSGFSLLTQIGLVDLSKSFYTMATLGVAGVALLAYALHFRALKHTIWIAPAIIMWFGYRSLQNYFVYWTPVMLVGLIAYWREEVLAYVTASEGRVDE